MQRLLQFTLDLFGAASGHPAIPQTSPAPRRKKSPDLKSINLLTPDECAQRAIEKVATSAPSASVDAFAGPALAAQTLQQALAPVTFFHPRATRETFLGGVAVAYEFRRGKRRTIGFSVGADGLTVSAPKWVPLYEIDKAVLEKSDWILKKLQETRARHQRMVSARIEWKDGATLPFLGEQITVVLDPRHAFGGVGAELKSHACETISSVAGRCLHVSLPLSASAEQIQDAVQAWLMRQAKQIFTERLTHFTPALGVQWRKLTLSNASTRWGSASADGSIRLNWRLIHFSQAVIDYVVVHELSHLRVMDHSPRFWDTVRTVVPDYAVLRGQLKDDAIPRW